MPLFLVPILARLAKVPAWAWKAAACICIVITLFLAHQHYARRAIAEAKAEQKAADDAATKKLLDQAQAKIDRQSAELAKLSGQIRTLNNEENARIHSDAGSLLVRGPGKATCPRGPGVSAASGGSQPANALPDAPRSSLSPADGQDLSAVPWTWLVDRAEEHDEAVAENRAWRAWYQQIKANWPKNTEAAH